ncbi:MAG: thioredoxin family protein [Proteobacteria bacterium]|nr:thioredoxin family protein [Pseudomonadota bacterium]MCL2308203.1 thioredoxin family protein [Pseudomonadota bacterium]
MKFPLYLLASLLVFAFAVQVAMPVSAKTPPPVKAVLISDVHSIAPGAVFTVALQLNMEHGWHVYWKNPGDTGLPTTITWTLPDGVTAGALQWPAPQAQLYGPFVNYGFEDEVLLLTEFKTTNIVPPSLKIQARADWLMCKEVCVPDGADLTLTLPVTATTQPAAANVSAITATRDLLPKPLTGWTAAAQGDGATVKLRLTPAHAEAPDPGALYFFADESRQIEPSFAQPLQRDGDALVLTLPVSHQLEGSLSRLRGVLRSAQPWNTGDENATAVMIDVPIQGAVSPGPVPTFDAPPTARPPGMATTEGSGKSGGKNLSLALAALFALLGGVILNLMPCVFPIISLKVLGFVKHGDDRKTLRHEALAFSAGVILTFLLLAGALLVLRAAGEQLGWGFQLQSPLVITGLALLFFVMALNFSGVFEFGALAPSEWLGWTARNRTLDAFGSGLLAVVVASPCTAPFMGAALGYALTQDALTTLVIFAMLGLGMALPYALLAIFPAWQRFLPKSGAWMLRLKQLLAFPLYATVAWLAWVLGAQTSGDIELRLLLALVAVALALWAWHGYRMAFGAGDRVKISWIATAVIGVVIAGWLISPVFSMTSGRIGQASTLEQAEVWQPYSAAAVAQENAAGKTVFVDFTAAWCVTCQANKKWVLDTDDVQQAFARHGIALMRADWTRYDPAITEALTALGRSGVPVYVFYRPGKPPRLLPELLQKGMVLDVLRELGSEVSDQRSGIRKTF